VKRTLIIGYQTTDEGRDALALGRVLAETTNSSPLVAMVFTWPTDLLSRTDLEAALRADSSRPLAAAADELAGLAPRTKALADLSPSSALASLAEASAASMIVVGSSHLGRIGRTLLGGTAASLLHGAPCSVAVAPRGYAAGPRRAMRQVGVAFDGSPEAWSALQSAIGLATRTDGRLTVITVADFPHYGYASALSALSAGDIRDTESRDRRRVLDLALARCPSELAVDGRLLTGDAGSVLADSSREFDVLLTGSRRHGPLRSTMLGSATRRLVSGAGCPVVVLPRATAADPLGLRTGSDALTDRGERVLQPAR
jgi:nucleotide-binding universal stress UspA family protein